MKKCTQHQTTTLSNIWATGSKTDILGQLPRSWKAIKRQAENMGLKRVRGPYGDQHQKGAYKTVKIPSWLIGEMLSDGHVDMQGRYCHTTKYQKYARFLESRFNSIGVSTKIYPNQYFDKRTNKTYSRFMLKTRSIFKKLRTEWYQPYKMVPEETQINDEVLHHWIMGDGSIVNGTFRLATMGFSDDSLQTLQNALSSYGLDVTLQKSRNIYVRRNAGNKQTVCQLIDRKLEWNCYSYKRGET